MCTTSSALGMCGLPVLYWDQFLGMLLEHLQRYQMRHWKYSSRQRALRGPLFPLILDMLTKFYQVWSAALFESMPWMTFQPSTGLNPRTLYHLLSGSAQPIPYSLPDGLRMERIWRATPPEESTVEDIERYIEG